MVQVAVVVQVDIELRYRGRHQVAVVRLNWFQCLALVLEHTQLLSVQVAGHRLRGQIHLLLV
jgi:hypothetical protein